MKHHWVIPALVLGVVGCAPSSKWTNAEEKTVYINNEKVNLTYVETGPGQWDFFTDPGWYWVGSDPQGAMERTQRAVQMVISKLCRDHEDVTITQMIPRTGGMEYLGRAQCTSRTLAGAPTTSNPLNVTISPSINVTVNGESKPAVPAQDQKPASVPSQ